ncbi:MAG: T9SS type A sorting domain-containing protein [Bacteroidales bacterium]|nr:T9SS type A sorting domain-containing protein [Bacteroidales bacterium]
MRNLVFIIIFSIAVPFTATAQYPNILIGTENSPNEPSICINPKNPSQMVAGSNTDNYYYSSDGGLTWTHGVLSSSLGVWGDPVVIADTAGNFYFFHLSVPTWPQWLDRIVCQKSVNGGQTWNDGSYMGLNGTKDQDKEWAVVNPVDNAIYTCWTQFDKYNSTAPNDSSNIMFSRSIDGGVTWSAAKRINRRAGDCLDMDNTVEGAVPAVGPNGEVYVSWAGPLGLVFTKSTDGGVSWPDSNLVIGDIPGGWDFAVPGIYRANGLPVTCCDLSDGPYRGTIYINWSDQRNGEDDTDIWLIKSTNGGTTWTNPQRVNDDPAGRQQFFTWMTIDQVTGYIYMVFYDRRNHFGNLTDVYMAVSTDGGESFNNFKVSESPFEPEPAIFFGDYTNIAAHNNIVRPIWTRLHAGNLSIMTALADNIFTGVSPEKESVLPISLEQNYPNPVHDITYITYKVYTPARISLKVFDMFGNIVAKMLENKPVSSGKYVEKFNSKTFGLTPGVYYYSLISNDIIVNRKMVVH